MSYHDDNDTLADDRDVFEDDGTDDSRIDDEFQQQEGCLFPDRCICAGDHTTDDCLTAEMADEMVKAFEQEISDHNPVSPVQ